MFVGGSDERHFRVVELDKKKVEIGGVSIKPGASPGSAARKLLTSIAHQKGLKKNKKTTMPKVKFCIQEYTQGSSKKVYGPYVGYFHKYTAAELKKASTAKGKIKFTMKPVVKLAKNNNKKIGGLNMNQNNNKNELTENQKEITKKLQFYLNDALDKFEEITEIKEKNPNDTKTEYGVVIYKKTEDNLLKNKNMLGRLKYNKNTLNKMEKSKKNNLLNKVKILKYYCKPDINNNNKFIYNKRPICKRCNKLSYNNKHKCNHNYMINKIVNQISKPIMKSCPSRIRLRVSSKQSPNEEEIYCLPKNNGYIEEANGFGLERLDIVKWNKDKKIWESLHEKKQINISNLNIEGFDDEKYSLLKIIKDSYNKEGFINNVKKKKLGVVFYKKSKEQALINNGYNNAYNNNSLINKIGTINKNLKTIKITNENEKKLNSSLYKLRKNTIILKFDKLNTEKDLKELLNQMTHSRTGSCISMYGSKISLKLKNKENKETTWCIPENNDFFEEYTKMNYFEIGDIVTYNGDKWMPWNFSVTGRY